MEVTDLTLSVHKCDLLKRSVAVSTTAHEERRTAMVNAADYFVFVRCIHCLTRYATFANRVDRKDHTRRVGRGITQDE